MDILFTFNNSALFPSKTEEPEKETESGFMVPGSVSKGCVYSCTFSKRNDGDISAALRRGIVIKPVIGVIASGGALQTDGDLILPGQGGGDGVRGGE